MDLTVGGIIKALESEPLKQATMAVVQTIEELRADGQNVEAWDDQLRLCLSRNGLEHYLDKELPPTRVETPLKALIVTFAVVAKARAAFSLSRAKFGDDLFTTFRGDPYKYYRHIFLNVAKASPARGRDLLRSLQAMRVADSADVPAFLRTLQHHYFKLMVHNCDLPDMMKIWYCLTALDNADVDWWTKLGDGAPDRQALEAFKSWQELVDVLLTRTQGLSYAATTAEKTGGVAAQTGDATGQTDGATKAQPARNKHDGPVDTKTVMKEFLEADDNLAHDCTDDADDADDDGIVVIRGERRRVIPRYAERKKVRHALRDASKGIQRMVFHSKFPNCPRCRQCMCQHPRAAWAYCDDCGFCHLGGSDECYVLNPHLRGTRPLRNKFRQTDGEPATAADAGAQADTPLAIDTDDDKDGGSLVAEWALTPTTDPDSATGVAVVMALLPALSL